MHDTLAPGPALSYTLKRFLLPLSPEVQALYLTLWTCFVFFSIFLGPDLFVLLFFSQVHLPCGIWPIPTDDLALLGGRQERKETFGRGGEVRNGQRKDFDMGHCFKTHLKCHLLPKVFWDDDATPHSSGVLAPFPQYKSNRKLNWNSINDWHLSHFWMNANN